MSAPGAGTRVAGIIGWPVDGSLSPAIHNAAFASLGLDWVYVAFPVAPGTVGEAIAGMRALGVAGLNVTMPHKGEVLAHLDEMDAEAHAAGAVNTIARDGDRLVGSNTDGRGFLRFLERDAGVKPGETRALVLGAGGSAIAIALALAGAGAEISVAARRPEQANRVASAAGGGTVLWDPASLGAAFAGADLVVNATPVGRAGDSLPFEPEAIGNGHLVVDLTYGSEETPLVRTARERGAKAFDGLGMLVHQAALSFETWTGVPAPLDVMAAAVGAKSA